MDASVLIALLSPTDAHAEVAVDMVLAHEQVLAHRITLAETLVRPARRGQARAVMDLLRGLAVTCSAADDEESLVLADIRARTSLRMPDCCVLQAAHTHDCPVATFDRTLASAALDLGIPVLSAV